MAANHDYASLALFCDFENIALGVRDAQYEKFDIRPVLERLLAKGSIVVKKAYCDWERYKAFKAAMHEANFELIEIPHVRQSGKNSADIRMVVDALDLCYTKSHVDTFVIISGDSDFSPLVSKLRENAKRVIGVGVKQSCSDLLVTNCDEFIYYDDLVRDREAQRTVERREREKRSPEEEARRKEKQEERKSKAVDMVAATFIDLIADRGESERIWASVLKEVVKRRNPGFNESYYGFRSFGNLLEEAANRGLLGFGRDDKGAFAFRAPARAVAPEGESGQLPEGAPADEIPAMPPEKVETSGEKAASGEGRQRNARRSRGGRGRSAGRTEAASSEVPENATGEVVEPVVDIAPSDNAADSGVSDTPAKTRRPRRSPRKAVEASTESPVVVEAAAEIPQPVAEDTPAAPEAGVGATKKRASRGGARTRKPKPGVPEAS